MSRGTARIVIINDDPSDVELLRSCLAGEARGDDLDIAHTGEAGIRMCSGADGPAPSCTIIDLHLPDMSGLDVIERLKDGDGEVALPVILFIDSGEQCKAATAALRAGAQDYIAKSWLTADGLACS